MPSEYNSLLEPLAAGRAYREDVQGASPAAGAHFVRTVPGEYTVRLVSVFCRLVTDATAANREVVLEFRDADDRRLVLAGGPVTVSATDIVDFSFVDNLGQPDWEVDGSVLVKLPLFYLPPTYDFRLFVVNVQVGDQLSRIRFREERFPTDGPR